MFPWGHAAVGYLLYAGYRRTRFDLQPHGVAVLALALGTQLPDLIDKPLAYQFAVLPSGRSLGHSLVFAGLLLMVLWGLAIHRDRRAEVGAFGIGYLTHLFGDSLYPALAGDVAELRFLAYPLLQPFEYDAGGGGFVAYLVSHLFLLDPTPTTVFEFGLTVLAVGLWYRHGLPGLGFILPDRSRERANQPD